MKMRVILTAIGLCLAAVAVGAGDVQCTDNCPPDNPPACGEVFYNYMAADWSDGSWVERSQSWCSESGQILSCNRAAGCDPSASTCMALDSPGVLPCN